MIYLCFHKVIPNDVWDPNGVLSLVSSALVNPSKLGFDTYNDLNVSDEILKVSSGFITALIKLLPSLPESHLYIHKTVINEIKHKLQEYGLVLICGQILFLWSSCSSEFTCIVQSCMAFSECCC